MIILKQSTARTLLIGPFLDDTDGKTAETGLTIAQADIRLSKNGGNMAQKNEATSCVHDELGYYTCPIDATDTATLGILKVMVYESGALPVFQEFLVVTANVWNTLCSTDQLDVNITNIAGTAQTANDNGADINEILVDTGTTLDTLIKAIPTTAMRGTDNAATETKQDIIDTNVDSILVDTGTTLDALIKDIPTVSEFEARSILADDYVVVGDTIAGVTTCTTNSDMRGTDNAATETKQDVIDGIVDRILTATEIKQAAVNDAAATTTSFVSNLTQTSNDYWNRNALVFTSGNNIGQMRKIHDYNGTTKAITLYTALDVAPADADTFVIVAARNFRMNLVDIAALNTEMDTALTDYGANTVVPDPVGTAATPAEVATALTNIHLDHLFAVDYDPASKPGVATALLNEIIESDSGVSRYTANALEQAPSGSGATAADVRIEMDANSTKLSSIETDTKGIKDTAVCADGEVVTVNSLSDIVRRMKWFVANLWEIDENTTPDTFKIFKDDNVSVGLNFTVYTDSSKSYRDNTP